MTNRRMLTPVPFSEPRPQAPRSDPLLIQIPPQLPPPPPSPKCTRHEDEENPDQAALRALRRRLCVLGARLEALHSRCHARLAEVLHTAVERAENKGSRRFQ